MIHHLIKHTGLVAQPTQHSTSRFCRIVESKISQKRCVIIWTSGRRIGILSLIFLQHKAKGASHNKAWIYGFSFHMNFLFQLLLIAKFQEWSLPLLCDVMGAFYQYIYFPSPPSLGMISRCSDCTVTVNAAYCTNNIGGTEHWEEYIVNDQKIILYCTHFYLDVTR